MLRQLQARARSERHVVLHRTVGSLRSRLLVVRTGVSSGHLSAPSEAEVYVRESDLPSLLVGIPCCRLVDCMAGRMC